MKAKSIQGASTAEIKTALENAMSDGYVPTLAIVFISIKQERKEISELLASKNIDVVGATSSGEFINGYQSEGGIAIMLLDMHQKDYCILYEDIGDKSVEDATKKLAHKALQNFKNPSFLLLTTSLTKQGNMIDGDAIIENIGRVIGPDTTIFGGMAGDDISFTGTYVFTNSHETDYGMVSLVFNADRINLQGIALSGWKPIGLTRTITKSEGNNVYTIEGKPALETYFKYLGEEATSAENQIHFFNSIAIHYPIQIERKGRIAKICNPVSYDKEKGALVFESEVPQGSKFRFSTPPDFNIIEDIIQSAIALKEETKKEAKAVLIFSCAGRLNALGPMAKMENEGIAKAWNAPMAGFYSYGEFGKSKLGKHEYHSTTNSWVVIKEK